MNKKLIVLLLLTLSMQACFEIRSFQVSEEKTIAHFHGNKYKQMVGMTENQILRSMPPLTKQTDDGQGGKILIWENIQDQMNHIAPSGTFVNFFINAQGISYDCSTNIGNIYTYETVPASFKCYKCWRDGTLREGTIWKEVPCAHGTSATQYRTYP